MDGEFWPALGKFMAQLVFGLGFVAVFIALQVLIFIAIRGLVLWYFKINEALRLLTRIERHLRPGKQPPAPAPAPAQAPAEPAQAQTMDREKDSFFPTAEQVELAKGDR